MVNIKPLSPELQAVANEELFEVTSRVPEDLNNFMLWISQQPHLKVRNDEQFLIQFLRGSKYSLERAKERLDLYYTLKSKYPELFLVTDIESPELKELLSLGCYTLLPKPLNDTGPRIVVFRYNFTVPQHHINDILRNGGALLDLALINDPYACVNGLVYILDMAKFTVKHSLHVTPGFLKKAFAFFSKTLPLRIKAVYFINTSPVALQFSKMLIPFFPNKIRHRVYLCGNDIKELPSHLPLQYLPQDYGGENGSMDELTLEWQKTLSDNATYFKENAAFGADESLRPGKPMDFDSLYGMEGSFRKLEVD